jgi:hypothetical protein
MKTLVTLACAPPLLLACSSNAPPGQASGEIAAVNRAGVDSIYISIVTLGTPSPSVNDAGSYRGSPVTVGSCTYYPPLAPVADPAPGSGTPNTEANVGTISVVDGASHGTVGTYPFASAGYTSGATSSVSPIWQAGDTLTATAAGGALGAFTVSVRALSAPSIAFPSTFSASKDLTLAWTPDPNAQSMTIVIEDATQATFVVCPVSDGLGTVTIDASLFAAFVASDTFNVSASRETDEKIEDGDTPIDMRSMGETNNAAILME